jgi:hypothetical protein
MIPLESVVDNVDPTASILPNEDAVDEMVIVSVPALVVRDIPVPATNVNVSEIESALTVDCPDTSISLNANVVDAIMFAATELGIVTKTVLLPPSKLTSDPAFDDDSTESRVNEGPAEL